MNCNDTHATKLTATDCTHQAQLIAFAYRELASNERRAFDAHLAGCVACRAELSEIELTRGDLSLMRAAIPAFSLADAPAFRQALAKEKSDAQESQSILPRGSIQQPRTAWTALREFFELCPVWMKTSGAFASLVICALAALALFNTEVKWTNDEFAFSSSLIEREKTVAPNQTSPVQIAPNQMTDIELESLVAARVESEIARREAATVAAIKDEAAANNLTVASKQAAIETTSFANANRAAKTTLTNAKTPARKIRRAPSNPVRNESDSLPRLYDLLADAN